MKSLVQTCTGYLCDRLDVYAEALPLLPANCKQAVLEWLVAHDRLCQVADSGLLTTGAGFMSGVTRLSFHLSEQLTDAHLQCIGAANRHLTHVSLVHCARATDAGLARLLRPQRALESLELVAVQAAAAVTDAVHSRRLTSVDLSGCTAVDSACVAALVTRNPSIRRLYLNNCTALDDEAIYSIGNTLGGNLEILELNFVDGLEDPAGAIELLAERCPNLRRLALCRYYDADRANLPQAFYRLPGGTLRELDLYGNYFSTLPRLPANITKLRLSCTGDEDVRDICHQLSILPHLNSVHLSLSPGDTDEDIGRAAQFLGHMLRKVGGRITGLSLRARHIPEPLLGLTSSLAPHLRHLSLDTDTFSGRALFALLRADGRRAGRLRSLRIAAAAGLTYRTLFAIARRCHNLRVLELPHASGVDNHFINVLTMNNNGCLSCVNFNGCHKVTDVGVCSLARRCPLRELRIRATAAGDKGVRCLAQCCGGTLEWVAHADHTGRPAFSAGALQALRNSCALRVIC